MLFFGPVSRRLQEITAATTEWLENERVPWAAIRGLMAGRIIALIKNPGVRPVGVGEVWRRMLAKVLLQVTGGEATDRFICYGPYAMNGPVEPSLCSTATNTGLNW